LNAIQLGLVLYIRLLITNLWNYIIHCSEYPQTIALLTLSNTRQ